MPDIPVTGQPAPAFALPDANGTVVRLDHFRGRNVVVYFYPRDMTSGCTREAVEFTALKKDFEQVETEIIGISADSPSRHATFRQKHDLKVLLLSDEERQAIEAYGVWVEKKMYGRTYMGIERASFLIDKNGLIIKVWRKVRLKGHVDAVLKSAVELAGKN
jgi:peroxiredoxin Q/BCP